MNSIFSVLENLLFTQDDLFFILQVTEVGLQKGQLVTSIDAQTDSKLGEGQKLIKRKSAIEITHNASSLKGLVDTNDFPIDGAGL